MGSIFEYLKENFDYREDPKWKPKTYKAVAKIIGISQTKAYKWGYDRKLKGEHKVDGRKTWRKQKLQLEKKTSSFTKYASYIILKYALKFKLMNKSWFNNDSYIFSIFIISLVF